jgi:hypothetical protein
MAAWREQPILVLGLQFQYSIEHNQCPCKKVTFTIQQVIELVTRIFFFLVFAMDLIIKARVGS